MTKQPLNKYAHMITQFTGKPHEYALYDVYAMCQCGHMAGGVDQAHAANQLFTFHIWLYWTGQEK